MIAWDTGLDSIPKSCVNCRYFRVINSKYCTGYCKFQDDIRPCEDIIRNCKLVTIVENTKGEN